MLALVFAAAASVGVNVHLPPDDALDLAATLGVGWIRIDFDWPTAEPQRGQRDYAVFDRVIDGARARGLEVFATIGYTPQWASTGDRKADGPRNDVPDADAYRAFVTDAARRYDGRVAAWGIWNEPNLEGFFEGTSQEWLDHVLGPGIAGVRAGCPRCQVVGPELATISDRYADWLRAALRAHGAELDVISWHIYAGFPVDGGGGVTSDTFFNKLDCHRVVRVEGQLVYEGPKSAREVLAEEGFAQKPLWITETGDSAAPDDLAALSSQARYLDDVLDAMAERPWWTRTFFYELTEEHPMGLWPDEHWGLALRTADPDAAGAHFRPKPAFDALRMRLSAPLATRPPVTGCPDGPDLRFDAGTTGPRDGGARDGGARDGGARDGARGDGGGGANGAAPGARASGCTAAGGGEERGWFLVVLAVLAARRTSAKRAILAVSTATGPAGMTQGRGDACRQTRRGCSSAC